MSEPKKHPTSFKVSKGVISEPSRYYRGDSIALDTKCGELIVIASSENAMLYASERLMSCSFKVDMSRVEDVVIFAHEKVTRQDAPQSEWVSVDSGVMPNCLIESQEDPSDDSDYQFDGCISETVEITDGYGQGWGHYRDDGKWISYMTDHSLDKLNVNPEKVTHYRPVQQLPTPPKAKGE